MSVLHASGSSFAAFVFAHRSILLTPFHTLCARLAIHHLFLQDLYCVAAPNLEIDGSFIRARDKLGFLFSVHLGSIPKAADQTAFSLSPVAS